MKENESLSLIAQLQPLEPEMFVQRIALKGALQLNFFQLFFSCTNFGRGFFLSFFNMLVILSNLYTFHA